MDGIRGNAWVLRSGDETQPPRSILFKACSTTYGNLVRFDLYYDASLWWRKRWHSQREHAGRNLYDRGNWEVHFWFGDIDPQHEFHSGGAVIVSGRSEED